MRNKWHHINRVTEAGLIQLINDLSDHCYNTRESWTESPTLKILKCNQFGPYQVNVLTSEWEGMLRDRVRVDAESRYTATSD